MHSIVHDLLDYARARHGSGLPVRPRPVRLGDICRSAIQEIRAAQPGGTILLNVTGDDSASLDPERVGQVVSNLVTNALTHGAAGSTVEVNVAEDDAGVRLQVANQGTIRQDVVPRLFEPFGSGDAPGAVGLGLFIVREIARSHGGSVSVRSGEPGTTFTVVFPKRVSEAPTAAALA